MDIEQAKKDWELNRLKSQREEEERKAELEEDDMLYTYSKEDGLNQVPRRYKKHKQSPSKPKRMVPEPSRKSKRPPMPKQLESESDDELAVAPKPKRGKRGRPKGSKNANTLLSSPDRTILIKSSISNDDSVTLKRKPGSKTYIISSPVTSSPMLHTNGVHQVMSPTLSDSDVDVESSDFRRARCW